MIYKDSLSAIIEAIYLEDKVDELLGKSDILVNPIYDPIRLDYTIDKTIILNLPDIDSRVIDKLKTHNHIISRLKCYESYGIEFQPYITRINFNVMWNGEEIEYPLDNSSNPSDIIDWIGDVDDIPTSPLEPIVLYFPKLKGINKLSFYDTEGNLNCLGWLMHQVGINLDINTKFKDLDLLKTKKLSLNYSSEKP